jgi:hypothetical protein
MDVKVSIEGTVSIFNVKVNKLMKWLFKPVARNVVTEGHGTGRRHNSVHDNVNGA